MGQKKPRPRQLSNQPVDESNDKEEDEQNEMVDALRESEEKFRLITEEAPVAIYVSVGLEQTAIYINPRFEKLFGYKIEEVPSVREWWPKAYPDPVYRKKVEEEWQSKVKVAIETKSYIEPMDVVVTCKDGSKKNTLWGFSSIGTKNIAFGLDITARKQAEADLEKIKTHLEEIVHDRTAELEAKNEMLAAEIREREAAEKALFESEERYRSLVETTSDIIWEVDVNGSYTYISPRIREVLGYAPEEFLGKSPFDMMPPGEAERVREIFKKNLKQKQAFNSLQNINWHRGGYPVVLETSGVPFYDAKGNLKGFRGIDRDITARKHDEMVLQESEEKFRSIAEQTVVGILILNRERVLYVNQRCAELWGYTVPEIEKISMKDFLGLLEDKNRQVVTKKLQELETAGSATLPPYVVKSMTKSGGLFWGEIYSKIITYDHQPAYLVIILDISGRKQAEEALRESEEKYRLLFNTGTDIITVNLLPAGGQPAYFVEVNDIACEKSGYTREELLAMTPNELIAPDELGQINRINKTLFDKKQVLFERKYLKKDGGTIPLEIHATLFNLKGQLAVLSICRDITERKCVEENLRESQEEAKFLAELLETSSQPFAVIDRNGYFGIVNDAFCKLVGYSKAELAEIQWDQITPPEWRESEKEKVTTLENEGQPLLFEKEYLRKDGSHVPVELLLHRVNDEDGSVKVIYAFVTDITERRAKETEIKNYVTEIERSNKELEQFASVTSHDLQAPLRAALGFLQLLERRTKGQLDAEALDYLTTAIKSAQRMQKMIGALLVLARTKVNEDDMEQVDCEEVLATVLEDLQGEILETHATITNAPLPHVTAVKPLLIQVFENLIDNAMKFHGKETPRIHVSVEEEQNKWTFSVKDNGIGFDQKYAIELFKPFRRLVTQVEYPGTGMGLSICKKIVERHGGQIWVESQEGIGSTFFFMFPKVGLGKVQVWE